MLRRLIDHDDGGGVKLQDRRNHRDKPSTVLRGGRLLFPIGEAQTEPRFHDGTPMVIVARDLRPARRSGRSPPVLGQGFDRVREANEVGSLKPM